VPVEQDLQNAVDLIVVPTLRERLQFFGQCLQPWSADIAAMDLFVVPTIGFNLLYAFVIVRLDGRDLVWINVTTNPTAERIARQLTEAFPWNEAPRYLIRDRDRLSPR